MKRLSKITNPRMISARVERSEADKLAELIGTQQVLTLQDFINYAISLANSGVIIIDPSSKEFTLNPEHVRT